MPPARREDRMQEKRCGNCGHFRADLNVCARPGGKYYAQIKLGGSSCKQWQSKAAVKRAKAKQGT